jgi:Antitoxin ParD
MSRLSIEISEQQHQQIKAMASISGLSIKEYVLRQTLFTPETRPMSEAEALEKLESLLANRIEAAERGELSTRSIDDLINEARLRRSA